MKKNQFFTLCFCLIFFGLCVSSLIFFLNRDPKISFINLAGTDVYLSVIKGNYILNHKVLTQKKISFNNAAMHPFSIIVFNTSDSYSKCSPPSTDGVLDLFEIENIKQCCILMEQQCIYRTNLRAVDKTNIKYQEIQSQPYLSNISTWL